MGIIGTGENSMGVSHWYEIIRHGSHWYEIIRHGSHWYEIIQHGSHWYGRILHGNEFTTRMSHSRIDKGSPGGAHHSGTSITTMEIVMVCHKTMKDHIFLYLMMYD